MIHQANKAVAEIVGGLVTDVQEGGRGGENGAINRLRRGKGGVFSRSHPHAKEDPGKLNWPGQASPLRPQSILQSAMHPLNHAIGLRVEGGGEDVADAQLLAEVRPDTGSELGPSVSGDGGRYTKTVDPVRSEGREN